MSARRAASLVLVLLALGACGRYGPPQPLAAPSEPAAADPEVAAQADDESETSEAP